LIFALTLANNLIFALPLANNLIFTKYKTQRPNMGGLIFAPTLAGAKEEPLRGAKRQHAPLQKSLKYPGGKPHQNTIKGTPIHKVPNKNNENRRR
jgi:hypothetical protein